VKYALKSFTKPVIIILGGRDKDSDFSLLLPLLRKHAKKAIIIGEAADKVKNVIDGIINYSHANSLENAVLQARNDAVAGDVILLAPACASFDMFDNYEHRGNVFKTLINSLTERDSDER
jgi:UDP-N-acetylmuramoylalanine--D-glutamate ligase